MQVMPTETRNADAAELGAQKWNPSFRISLIYKLTLDAMFPRLRLTSLISGRLLLPSAPLTVHSARTRSLLIAWSARVWRNCMGYVCHASEMTVDLHIACSCVGTWHTSSVNPLLVRRLRYILLTSEWKWNYGILALNRTCVRNEWISLQLLWSFISAVKHVHLASEYKMENNMHSFITAFIAIWESLCWHCISICASVHCEGIT